MREGPRVPNWQLAGTVDLPPGETEIAVRGEGPGRKECDAVLISPTVTTLAGVEEVCALARRLRQTPSPGQLAAVFDDGRRIEGNLVSGWRGSGVRIARDGPARPGVRCLRLDGLAADPAPQSDALLEFHNGDRMRGTICGYVAASTEAGQSVGAQVLVQPSQDFGKSTEKPIAVETDWLRRIVFDAAGPPRRCPPRSLVCRDGRVIAFRALRFSGEGVSLLTDQGLVRLAYRDLAEVAMQPIDAWEAYHRQLAEIDPKGDAGIVRLETGQGMVFTASTTPGHGVSQGSARRPHRRASSQPAWSRTPIPVAWSAVRTLWRAPATVVPLSLFAPEQVAQRGALGSSWKWQADRNVAGGELRSGGVRYLWGFGVHAPNELVFPLPDSRTGLPERPGNRRRRVGDSRLCRGEGLRQRSRPARPCSKASRCWARGPRFPPARSRCHAAIRPLGNWCWSWRTAATPAGRTPIRWTSAIMPTGWNRSSCSIPPSSVRPWKSIGRPPVLLTLRREEIPSALLKLAPSVEAQRASEECAAKSAGKLACAVGLQYPPCKEH